MDKLFAQQAIAETYAELSRERQMHRDLQSEKDRHWQWAKEYKLVATPAVFEEQSVDYDVEGAWKKLRAARADECWRFIQHHQDMYRAHLERICAPAYVQQEAVDQTSLLSRHPQLYDASALEERCARVKDWAQLVVRQSFAVKAEQLRVKQEKEKCRQRTLESAQTEYEAMDARSFVVALQLEAAGLKRRTTEDKQRGKPARYVDQSTALGSLLVEREDMQHAYGIKVRPNSGKNPGVLRAKTLRTSRQSSLASKSGRSNSRTSVRSTSRASQKSARSQASVASKASGRARSTVSSRRGSSNVPQKNRTGKSKGRGRGSNKGRDNSNKGKAPGSKNGKGHKSSRNPS